MGSILLFSNEQHSLEHQASMQARVVFPRCGKLFRKLDLHFSPGEMKGNWILSCSLLVLALMLDECEVEEEERTSCQDR